MWQSEVSRRARRKTTLIQGHSIWDDDKEGTAVVAYALEVHQDADTIQA